MSSVVTSGTVWGALVYDLINYNNLFVRSEEIMDFCAVEPDKSLIIKPVSVSLIVRLVSKIQSIVAISI